MLTSKEFLKEDFKAITLIGMSGIGKSHYSSLLKQYGWHPYSIDVRIGAHYLSEQMLDDVRKAASQIPYLRDLLKTNSIDFKNQTAIHNLQLLSKYIGRIGNPKKGGFDLDTFLERQDLYRHAEIQSMMDIPSFISRAQNYYGVQNFIVDTSGSLCELNYYAVLQTLAQNTLIVYIEADDKDEEQLLKRALKFPKPLLYNKEFFLVSLETYMSTHDIKGVSEIDADDFHRWVFPKLFRSRIPKYKEIADKYGYTISSKKMRKIDTADDFLELVGKAIDEKNT